jgi:DMSO/TMAO reductase YedYZ molybdopterin-dependent catalytic subunit
MAKGLMAKLTRRKFVKASVISGGALFTGFYEVGWPELTYARQRDAFTGGRLLGAVEFLHEGPTPMETALGAELDGRLYTDLSRLESQDPVTATEKFYIRTRASELLPDSKSWQVNVDGLVGQPSALTIENLKRAAKPMDLHLMECAGNTRVAHFGMISVADWTGVTLSEILDNAKAKSGATRVLISGFDRYAKASATSIPGASWVFTMKELRTAGAFLATGMNGQPLNTDHGAPVRLVVPGWYGCSCIKWVDRITFVDDGIEATSQMQEYAARTHQKGSPRLARDFQPAIIDQAAMPTRVEKWLVDEKIKYSVAGILWGGSQPVKDLEIRFNPEEDYVRVDSLSDSGRAGEAVNFKNDPWTLWSHAWSPKEPGTYSIRLAVKDPPVQARRLDSGYYVRSVEILEV